MPTCWCHSGSCLMLSLQPHRVPHQNGGGQWAEGKSLLVHSSTHLNLHMLACGRRLGGTAVVLTSSPRHLVYGWAWLGRTGSRDGRVVLYAVVLCCETLYACGNKTLAGSRLGGSVPRHGGPDAVGPGKGEWHGELDLLCLCPSCGMAWMRRGIAARVDHTLGP